MVGMRDTGGASDLTVKVQVLDLGSKLQKCPPSHSSLS